MKESIFNALTTVNTQSEIDSLSIGTFFLYGPEQIRQKNISLRHRILYNERVASFEYPQGTTKNYHEKWDILESDSTGLERKTSTRRNKSTSVTRDDDNARDIIGTGKFSSSSTSSSSTSSSSSSTSSSSFSDAAWMGNGWPYQPDEIEVVIGSRWKTPFGGGVNTSFVEDDVITLIRHENIIAASYVVYSEDGSLTPNESTNRIKIQFGNGRLLMDVANGTDFDRALDFIHSYQPYDFGAMFDAEFNFTASALTNFFDVGGVYYGINPAVEWNGDVFKTITFIDN